MKTGLDHLPAAKRRELERIKTVLMSEFEKAIAGGTQLWRRNGKILKIVLFGSFGRGDWVDDPHSGYRSDWDLLVIVNYEQLTPIEDYWYEAEDRLLRDRAVKRPITLIVHTLDQVNQALTKGEYFWVDIIRDGVLLYELPGRPLATPQPLTPADAYEMAKKYFDEKHAKIVRWFVTVEFQASQSESDAGFLCDAAFSLHQAVETIYACFLLVSTFYLPASHNIKFFRSLAEDKDKRLVDARPRATKIDRRRFELLKRAYVEARYSESYEISAEDLNALKDAAQKLRSLVEEVCRERLDELRIAAG